MLALLAVVMAHVFVLGYSSMDTEAMKHTATYDTMLQCQEEATDTQVCVVKKDGGAYLFSE